MEKRDLILNNKVLILGSAGLIGHQVFYFLKNNTNYEIFDISFRKKLNEKSILLDATNLDELTNYIERILPKYIINCIGVLNKDANLSIQNTIFLNAILPHELKSIADQINSKLIHMSTDCVFSGYKGSSYIETDNKDGHDIYSKTKGLGEIICDKHLTLRTSVVGPELKDDGSELFHWFMSQTEDILGFTNVFWSGVTTFELAKAINWSLDHNLTGLYHITNNERISKYDLLKLFKKYTKKSIEVIPSSSKNFDKSFIDTRRLLDYQIPSYEKMVIDMVDLIHLNKKLYSKYILRK